MTFDHYTVMKSELVDSLRLSEGSIALDATAGGGGHTARILSAVGKSGKVYAIDRDPMALEHLKAKFASEIASGQLILCPYAFSQITAIATEHGLTGRIDGICADIGVSSPQLDIAERGFSFNRDGPLDMRMDTRQGVDAATVVNTFDEADIADIIYQFGEEPKSRFVARAIVNYRQDKPFTSTLELADVVSKSIHYKTKSKKHPATKTFQALRIFVNNELGELEDLCRNGFNLLKPGGRLAVITFHSLEDKLVKRYFKTLAKGEALPGHLRRAPITEEKMRSLVNIQGKIIKPFPTLPSEEEIAENPRSRSAKLRTIEKNMESDDEA